MYTFFVEILCVSNNMVLHTDWTMVSNTASTCTKVFALKVLDDEVMLKMHK
jgi:hypothetical protein